MGQNFILLDTSFPATKNSIYALIKRNRSYLKKKSIWTLYIQGAPKKKDPSQRRISLKLKGLSPMEKNLIHFYQPIYVSNQKKLAKDYSL